MPSEEKIKIIYQDWLSYHESRIKIFNEFSSSWSKKQPVLQIPDFNMDVSGLSSLEVVSNEIEKRLNEGVS